MLTDLLRGAAPASETAGSTGLSGLIAGAAVQRMSLPQALNAMRRGELERPLVAAQSVNWCRPICQLGRRRHRSRCPTKPSLMRLV